MNRSENRSTSATDVIAENQFDQTYFYTIYC